VDVDVVIVGAGPVGLYGAYYAGLRGLTTIVIDSLDEPGGQVSALYPEKLIFDIAGFPAVSGRELISRLLEQANRYDPTFLLGDVLESVSRRNDGRLDLATARGRHIVSSALVIACGIGRFTPRALPAADDYVGRGADYFVSRPEAHLGHDVVIVGGGDSALDWALTLEPLAASVTLVHRRARFTAHPATVRAVEASGVRVITDAEIASANGDEHLETIDIRAKDGTLVRTRCTSLIAALGFLAEIGPVRDWGIDLRDNRYITVDSRMETNVPRVFGAGDAVDYPGKVRLISVGFGEIATAVNNAATVIDDSASLFPGHSTDVIPATV
jgi:thioredoxin reductase